MDERRDDHTECSEPDRETQVSYDGMYIEKSTIGHNKWADLGDTLTAVEDRREVAGVGGEWGKEALGVWG